MFKSTKSARPRVRSKGKAAFAIVVKQSCEPVEVYGNLTKQEAETFARMFREVDRDASSSPYSILPAGRIQDTPEGLPTPDTLARSYVIRRLEKTMRGEFAFRYDPKVQYDGDPDLAAHCFTGFVSPECGEDGISLDDRLPVPLDMQLAAEFRRIAQWYEGLARMVECHKRWHDKTNNADSEVLW